MTAIAPLLRFDGVICRFGAVTAVGGVSCALESGGFTALVGASGSGKSTLLKTVNTLVEPTAGRVLFGGEDVSALSPSRLRRRVGYVFQGIGLFPHFTVAENIAIGPRLTGDKLPPERIAELLALVGLLPEHADRYPHEFSGGQRQRIGIARALASRPKLVLGDEPVSALDVSIRAQIINLLEDLKAELGLTMLLVSHDLGVVRHTADRVAVMYLGEIVEMADVERLFARPAHPYTRALMEAIPAQDPSGRRDTALLEGDPPSPSAPPPGCRFHTRCPHAIALCRATAPPLAAIGPGHVVACHRASEFPARDVLAIVPGSEARQRRIALFAAASNEASRRHPD
jgi:oligopeptide/dipeptide ABC transporter ATP-binding protein